MRRAPAADHRAAALGRKSDDLVGGEDGQAGLVGGEPLEEARATVEQPDHMALAHAHAVGELVDHLVVHHWHFELGAERARDVLPERTHFPRYRYDWHGPPPSRIAL